MHWQFNVLLEITVGKKSNIKNKHNKNHTQTHTHTQTQTNTHTNATGLSLPKMNYVPTKTFLLK